MFILITLLSILGLISTDILVPSMPTIAAFFQITSNQAQLIISLFLLGFSFSQLFYGPWSDKIGRKKPLLMGITIFMFGSLICLTTSSIHILYIGRLIQGIGAGAGLSLARVILRDLYYGKELGFKTSKIASFVSLSPAIAPFIGGSLYKIFGFISNFYFMFFYSLIMLLSLCFFYKETNKEIQKELSWQKIYKNYQDILINSKFIVYSFIAGLAFSSIIIYANILPFILQKQYNLSPFQSGLLILCIALGISFGAKIGNLLLKEFTSEALVQYGLLVLLAIGFILIWTKVFISPHLLILACLLFFITSGIGFLLPNALTVAFASVQTNFGTAGAVYGSIQISMSTLISFLLNIIHYQNQLLLGLMYLLIGFVGYVIYLNNAVSEKYHMNRKIQ